MKTGLVLEGGAMRGLFTAGVLDVFMENNLSFDGAIGVSAGATFGCNLKSKQRGRVLRYSLKYCKDWHYCSFRSLFLTGNLYNEDFAYRKVPQELDVFDAKTFHENPMEFYAVATDAKTGQPLYHKCIDGLERDLKWIQGSASIPGFAKAVHVDGFTLFDGGVSDSIPFEKMASFGYEKEVLILTQASDYQKKPQKHKPVVKKVLNAYPEVYQQIENRYQRYNETLNKIKEEEAKGNIFVIRPKSSLEIGPVCHDPNELKRVYYLGRFEAVKQLKALKAYLKNEHKIESRVD